MAKKIKLPKKVAGYRVPKSVRKSTLLRALLNNPMGRDVLANALRQAPARPPPCLSRTARILPKRARRERRRACRRPLWLARRRRAPPMP